MSLRTCRHSISSQISPSTTPYIRYGLGEFKNRSKNPSPRTNCIFEDRGVHSAGTLLPKHGFGRRQRTGHRPHDGGMTQATTVCVLYYKKTFTKRSQPTSVVSNFFFLLIFPGIFGYFQKNPKEPCPIYTNCGQLATYFLIMKIKMYYYDLFCNIYEKMVCTRQV